MYDEVEVDPNNLDVDLLVRNYYEVKRFIDRDLPLRDWEIPYEDSKYMSVNTVLIGSKHVHFDVRYVEDTHLDTQWQHNTLQ